MEELTEAIDLHYARTRPTKQSQSAQKTMLDYVERCTGYLKDSEGDGSNPKRVLKNISPVFIENTSWRLFMFGSKSDGTSSPSSDIDIGIHLNFRANRGYRRGLLLKLSQIISKYDPNRSFLVKCLLRARYPIIKIYDIQNHDTVNVSIADRFCFQRNELIKRYIAHHTAIYTKSLSTTSDCINKLIVFIKHWSKARGINNAYSGYLNSFGFVVMIIKFIQWFELNQLKKRKEKKEWNLGEILHEFYKFYVIKFDWNMHCISIKRRWIYDDYTDKDGVTFDYKNPYVALHVVDPVNAKNNITRNVDWRRVQLIKYEFIRALSIMDGNKGGLFDTLCDDDDNVISDDVDVRFDKFGNVYVDYPCFEYSYKRGKDIRYVYDPYAKCILTPLPK